MERITGHDALATVLAYCRARRVPAYVVYATQGTSARLVRLDMGARSAEIEKANGDRIWVPTASLYMRANYGR